MTQHQLAGQIGVTRVAITWWEKGDVPLSFERAKQVVKALRMQQNGPKPMASSDYIAANLMVVQNTEVLRMFLDAPGEITPHTGIRMLKKMKPVLDMRPFYSRENARALKNAYYELVDRTFRGGVSRSVA